MGSQLTWLDQDEQQRRRMHAVMQLFKEEGTIDELGVGSIRDAVADVLFPGGSILHTRARYLLFVPWLAQRAGTGRTPEAATQEFRKLEIHLISALMAGGETSGVIGRQARGNLRRMPSAAYWAALGRYGIRQTNTTVEGFFRRFAARERLRSARGPVEDPGDRLEDEPPGLHPDLPPAPEDLLTAAVFALTHQESDFLADRIRSTSRGSLLAWLLGQDTIDAEQIWRHPRLADFPADMGDLVEHGRRFATVIHGAPVVYNLLLAEQQAEDSGPTEPVERYRGMLADWQREMADERPLDGWDLAAFWGAMRERGRPIPAGTRGFVETWVHLAARGVDAHLAEARRLVRDREVALKGGRARVVNRTALAEWKGDSALVRLDYRWAVARRTLLDIAEPAPGDGAR